jgi:hypothetical protein
LNASRAALLAAAVLVACGSDSRGPTPCGASIYLGSAWVDATGLVAVGAGIYAVGWFDPGDTWDGSEVPGDDTSTPVGDDTSDGSGDGTDPSVGDDTSGGDPSGGDTSGGDTSGGGGDSTSSLRPAAVTPATFSRDANGCYECLVVCATVASTGSPSQERLARGFSVYGHDQACAHAVGALERWAHRVVDAKLATCEDVDGAEHTPASPSIGAPAPSATVKAGAGVDYQRRSTATPADPGPLGVVK